MEIEIYTDGATKKNGSADAEGGWGFIALIPTEKGLLRVEKGKKVKNTTNNRMEMTAVIEAIKYIKQRKDFSEMELINIYIDSAYIINCFKDKWYINWQSNNWINSSKESVKNRELWEQLIPYFENSKFNFIKVQGHYGNKYNEIADKIARSASQGFETNGADYE